MSPKLKFISSIVLQLPTSKALSLNRVRVGSTKEPKYTLNKASSCVSFYWLFQVAQYHNHVSSDIPLARVITRERHFSFQKH